MSNEHHHYIIDFGEYFTLAPYRKSELNKDPLLELNKYVYLRLLANSSEQAILYGYL